jgi:hypothetical protein
MPRLPLPRRSRDIPWAAVLTLAMKVAQEGRKRWDRLSAREQRQVTDALRRSKGRIDHLSQRERTQLRELVWKALRAK